MTLLADLHIGLGLNGIGHDPDDFDAGHAGDALAPWQAAVLRADEAGLDFVTLEDRAAQPGTAGYTSLDAILLASRIGPATRQIGIIPAAVVSINEPFHLSTAIATLDYVTEGRAGLLPVVPRVGDAANAYAHAGAGIYGIPYDEPDALYRDAADAAEVIRRLWDSWEDGAIIRDAATGRFVDRGKLHYVDYLGNFLRVRGPSIVPRPPQGQVPVAVAVREPGDVSWAAAYADIAFIPISEGPEAPTSLLRSLDDAQRRVGRTLSPLRYFADVAVAFGGTPRTGRTARDSYWFTGTPAVLAARLQQWQAQGLHGVRLHPHGLRRDVETIVGDLLGAVDAAGLRRRQQAGATAQTLRARLGLPAATNRYAAGQNRTVEA
jgi:alkanesulfonate monooxygenase SsuD/methylene tetrahydromethanopterin reductase-like flavin-dependent oxidoreductase (luciferase family)